MEQRLDDYLSKLDRYAVEDGEADGLLGCWLCGGYFEELVDGLLCAECDGYPDALHVARLCREFDARLEKHKKDMAGVKEAMRRAADAIEQSERYANRVNGVSEAIQRTFEAMEGG